MTERRPNRTPLLRNRIEQFPTWSFDGSRRLQPADPADYPELIELRDALPSPLEGGAISRLFLESRNLRVLPLTEWHLSDWMPLLFELLRERSSAGFMFDVPGQKITEFRKFALDAETAEEIRRRSVIDFHWMFVDDHIECVIVPWYSDACQLCMTPALFERFLAKARIDFSLDGDEPPALTFADALRSALRSNQTWGETWPTANRALMEKFRAEFEWQLETP